MLATDIQYGLGTLLNSSSWRLSMTEGVIKFPEAGLEFPAQIMGTVSEFSNTWLWGWANPKSGIPEKLLQIGNSAKQFGTSNNIPELREPTFDVLPYIVTGYSIACVCGQMFGDGDPWYRGPYAGGAVWLVIVGVFSLLSDIDTNNLRLSVGIGFESGFTFLF